MPSSTGVACVLLLAVVLAGVAAVAEGTDSALFLDDNDDLHITSKPGMAVIINNVNISALLDRLAVLENFFSKTTTSTTSTTSSTSSTSTTSTATTTSTTTTSTTLSPFAARLVINSTDRSACTGAWTTASTTAGTLCLRADSVAGCGSIFIAPSRPYTTVTGWVTLYQFGSCDAFALGGSFPIVGDSLSIWGGTTILWDYAVGLTTFNAPGHTGRCPASGGSSPPEELSSFWSCASGNSAGDNLDNLVLYSTPVFGPTASFTRTLPDATTDQIELRICLDQDTSNENIYVGEVFIQAT